MVARFKIIHDSVHGSVKLEGVFLSLLERPEMQRLHGIRQLGLAHLVFPGANHTRLEHSLGTLFLAERMADSLGLDEMERHDLKAAAMLHDLGHPPFSHTLEAVVHELTGRDHMEASRQIIEGGLPVIDRSAGEVIGDIPPIREVLEDDGISAERVGRIIVSDELERFGQKRLQVENSQSYFGGRNYLKQIIHGPVDADQMDYLLRDAHYTGVAHGAIDIDRLLQTVAVHHGDLVVQRGGVVAVEGMLVARALMYTSVYFHKTVRIAEMMLCKALELGGEEIVNDIHAQSECSLSERLINAGGAASKIMTLLRYRRLYKRVLSLRSSELTEEEMERVLPLSDYRRRKAREHEIADRAGVNPSEVILDVPTKELMLSEPRIGKTEVLILDGEKVKPLSKYSPLARALQYRNVHDWVLMVSAPKEVREKVEKAARKALF